MAEIEAETIYTQIYHTYMHPYTGDHTWQELEAEEEAISNRLM
jgi:hypothetical protein